MNFKKQLITAAALCTAAMACATFVQAAGAEPAPAPVAKPMTLDAAAAKARALMPKGEIVDARLHQGPRGNFWVVRMQSPDGVARFVLDAATGEPLQRFERSAKFAGPAFGMPCDGPRGPHHGRGMGHGMGPHHGPHDGMMRGADCPMR